MSTSYTKAMSVAAGATGAGTAYPTQGVGQNLSILLHGTFSATYQIQASSDGTNWVTEGADLTAPGNRALIGAAFYRINCTVWVSGQGVAYIHGRG